MVFILLLGFSAFSIAIVAAYFSIYGLAAIFSGFFWQVIAMGVVLELGKLVTASYVYRYGDLISKTVAAYYYAAIFVLMLITSAGIFGFLSQGYQEDTLSLKQQTQQISLLETEQIEIKQFKIERIERKKQIDNDIAALPNNYITARQRLMKTYGSELEALKKDIADYTKSINEKTIEISKIKQEKLINEVHIGPIIFIAKAFDETTDTATKWLILLLIFAFDPLAVMLTIATNHAMMIRSGIKPGLRQKKQQKVNIKDIPTSSDETTEDTMIQSIQAALEKYKTQDLSAEDLMHRQLLEEMLKRKLVTAKLRGNGD